MHINLNTGTAPEMLLIPRVAKRMTHEFEEYRPWVSMAQFDKEIGKYVDAAEMNRLKQYVFIPLDLNTASDEQFKTIPESGGQHGCASSRNIARGRRRHSSTKRLASTSGAKETARLWRFMTIK